MLSNCIVPNVIVILGEQGKRRGGKKLIRTLIGAQGATRSPIRWRVGTNVVLIGIKHIMR